MLVYLLDIISEAQDAIPELQRYCFLRFTVSIHREIFALDKDLPIILNLFYSMLSDCKRFFLFLHQYVMSSNITQQLKCKNTSFF